MPSPSRCKNDASMMLEKIATLVFPTLIRVGNARTTTA
jgi:hypothetical protein